MSVAGSVSIQAVAGAGSVEACRVRCGLRPLTALLLIAWLCLSVYGPTIQQRSHYSDDFPNRLAVERSGWWGACGEYWTAIGIVRPLGYVAIMACQQWLWDAPLVQQGLLVTLLVTLCGLVYAFARQLTGDSWTALVAAAMLAAWPSYTSVVVWVASGMQMLPAYIGLLAAMLLFLRHLRLARERRWWAASWAAFGTSILFYDQHLGTAAVFTLMALVLAPVGRKWLSTAWTAPYWLASLAMGLVAMFTARGSERPLEPSVTNLVTGFGTVLAHCFDRSLGEPLRDCLIGAGPRESVSRMLADDPVLLALGLVLLLAGVGATAMVLGRTRLTENGPVQGASLAWIGLVIVSAGVGLLAMGTPDYVHPRHTLLPAIGLALAAGPAFSRLRGLIGRAPTVALLICVLTGLSVFRLGYTYEWTTRAQVTEHLLASLDELYPSGAMPDLLVIDGVRKYGRGFCDSSGLSGAVSYHHGHSVRVATLVRREGNRLYANRPWDARWAVDPRATPFLLWNEPQGELRPMTFDEFVARHPEIQPRDVVWERPAHSL